MQRLAMIRKLGLWDFSGHRETRLELGRFTMLVGDNASGKTSVLDALALQGSLAPNPVGVLRDAWAPRNLVRRGGGNSARLVLEGVRGQVPWSTQLELQLLPTSSASGGLPWNLRLRGNLGGEEFTASSAGKGGGGSASPGWDKFAEALGAVRLYRLRAERIAAAAYSDVLEIRIEPDGTNTAVALAAMKLGSDEVFQRVEDAMRKLIPSVERVGIRPVTVPHPNAPHGVVGSKLYFDFRGAPGVPADGASHGTLIVLALFAILYGSKRPNLILLDDFDHALHPRTQRELVRTIKGLLALDEFNDVQIVATTHSPYVLDEMDPADVYAFALRDDGTVASRRLSEHPEAAKTRGTLKAGQLWSLGPERDWVLRG